MRRTLKSNTLWSLAIGGLVFGVLFGWMLYYAATAQAGTSAHPHLAGMPIFSVHPIDHGFEIGPEYGLLAVPLCSVLVTLALSFICQYIARRLTRSLPQ
jgi:hypothetical protein